MDMIMIPFNIPTTIGTEIKKVNDCIERNSLSGGGTYSDLCSQEILKILNSRSNIFMTPSCTSSLEAASLILGLMPGDEIIMPSFTFVTTATSFSNRGIKVKFIDIRPDTLNMDESKIEDAITAKTRAIVPVHYAGVACEMDEILKIARDNNLFVIEDAAQSLMSKYKNRPLGSIGDIAAFSFHDTKNIHCGEGGTLIINQENLFNRSHCVVNKGTNRKEFLEGRTEKYTWITSGSSYSLGELSCAYLLDQLRFAENITQKRLSLWNRYYENLKDISDIELPKVPDHCDHNGHIFYIKLANPEERKRVMLDLKREGISSCFHFVPLHSAPAGKIFGEFIGDDMYTTSESSRTLRLPIFHQMTRGQVDKVCELIRVSCDI